MTIVRSGATQNYSSGWEQAFGKGRKKITVTAAKKKSKPAGKKSVHVDKKKQAKRK